MTGLDEKLKELNKSYGQGTINELSKYGDTTIERIPTGSYSLDWVMGDGLAAGRIMEIYGEPSSGKSVMSLFIIKEIQKRGGKAAYIDCENSFSADFSKTIGVNTDSLIFSQAVIAEDVLNIVNELVKTNELDIIVVDSVASMVPKKEMDGDVGAMQVALTARLMSQALRKMTGAIAQTKTSVIFINQTRANIGMFVGNPTTTAGGKSLRFYASIRLEVKKGKNITSKGGEVIGNVVVIKATKNKTAMPFRHAELSLYYNKGIDVVSDILDVAVSKSIITKAGHTYSYKEKKLGVGRDEAKNLLSSDDKLLNEIRQSLNE